MITIRRAAATDHAAINAIVQGSSAYGGVYRAILDGYEVTARQIVETETWLAEEEAPLGFYSLVLDAQAELDLMFVSDAAQGRGVGRVLFDHMRGVAKAHGGANVKIVSHPPALNFYRRMGAIEVGFAYPQDRVSWARPVLLLPL